MKKCFKCSQVKPLDDFYKHPQMGCGHLGKCKACTRADSEARRQIKEKDPEWAEKERVRHLEKSRRWRERQEPKEPKPRKKRQPIYNESWPKRNPEKMKAHNALNNAVRDGKVKPMPCVRCGAKAHGHHEDYSKPLDVVWLCPLHHSARHVEIRKERQSRRNLATSK